MSRTDTTRRQSPARATGRSGRTGISLEVMAARRAERLVNLVICLLSTRQFITAEHIRAAVPGYETSYDGADRVKVDEAFKRMFERDKAELRDLGVPLETGRNSIFDSDDGYRISRREYELPPIQLDPSEAAAVGLAARLWQSATLGPAARNALIKLQAAGADVAVSGPAGATLHIDASDPQLPALIDAARLARTVSFDYLKAEETTPSTRIVQPWGVLSWRSRWYLVGYDCDRDAPRSFRLSRIAGGIQPLGKPGAFQCPDSVDLQGYVSRRPVEQRHQAVVRVGERGAGALRRLAQTIEPAPDSNSVLTISYGDETWLARMVAGAGASARVISPPSLVSAVTSRLRDAAAITAMQLPE